MGAASRPRGYMPDYRPQERTKLLLCDVLAVLDEYEEHLPLTSRQIFYRLIGAYGYEKTEAFYGKLCHHIAMARRGRMIPFKSIRDDGVTTFNMEHFDDADDFRAHLRLKAKNYQRNLLASQAVHVEVWCEAAGMLPQLYRVASKCSVQVYSSSGFDSLSAKKMIAERVCEQEKRAVILHLGDYDPSGVAMFNAAAEDVTAFVMADRPHGLVNVEFRRVCLTADQVKQFKLPTAPAKTTDSRTKSWSGETCQLEALAPDQIASLLQTAIEEVLNLDLIDADLAIEAVERIELIKLLLPAPDPTAGRNKWGDAAMNPPTFLIAQHPRRGTLWAAVDKNARFPKAEIAERRFGAYLAPFTSEDDARDALIAAGGVHVEAEDRKRRGRR